MTSETGPSEELDRGLLGDETSIDEFEDEFADTSADGGGEDGSEGEESYLDAEEGALWEGDKGTLDARERDVLISLLKKAFVSSDDGTEWRTLMKSQSVISQNLNNLYLKLVVDERSEVAYTIPARTADNAFKTLVRDAPNNREETLLLLYLRERFRASTAAGDGIVFTDVAAMYDYVQRFRPTSATDQVGDERRVTNAIAGIVTAGLLVKTRDEGRFRIHRAIEALLPLTKLNQLLEAFQQASGTTEDADEHAGYAGKHAAPTPVHIDEPEELTELDHANSHEDFEEDPA